MVDRLQAVVEWLRTNPVSAMIALIESKADEDPAGDALQRLLNVIELKFPLPPTSSSPPPIPDSIEPLIKLLITHRLDSIEIPGQLIIRKSQHDVPPAVALPGQPSRRPRPAKPADLGALPPEELLGHAAQLGARRPAERQALDAVGREIDEEEAGRG